jgi:hypothetical protein
MAMRKRDRWDITWFSAAMLGLPALMLAGSLAFS